ncbi:MAG: hypothetical protein HY000_29800 [Planctomycetes bacterium]|nr:hypothetical protein [Planctomycetota bacterium]
MAEPECTKAREAFAEVYASLLKLSREKRQLQFAPRPPHRMIFPDAVKYPEVGIRPNGDVIGPYVQVLAYLRDCQLTGRRKTGGRTNAEAHHLLEDRCMKHFGITKNEGLAIALEELDHAVFSAELPWHLPRGSVYFDIDVVYDAHCEMYRQAGHADWIAFIDKWLRRLETRILAHYTAGQLEGATEEHLARVRKFFRKL